MGSLEPLRDSESWNRRSPFSTETEQTLVPGPRTPAGLLMAGSTKDVDQLKSISNQIQLRCELIELGGSSQSLHETDLPVLAFGGLSDQSAQTCAVLFLEILFEPGFVSGLRNTGCCVSHVGDMSIAVRGSLPPIRDKSGFGFRACCLAARIPASSARCRNLEPTES